MKKDVIYIDIEDDITAIIGKVKGAPAKIVALVPPKRTGVLQSAVNLKLLQKTASSAGKRVVLITNDHLLTSLAAGVKMPVAKNLQSRPEIPQIAALQVDDDEIIKGEDLPVGELAAAAGMDVPADDASTDGDDASVQDNSPADDISNKVDLATAAVASPAMAAKPSAVGAAAAGKAAAKPKGGGKIKVPNFNSFRKKLFIVGGILLVAIPFLVWAIGFAPRANITIKAKTTDVNIDRTLALSTALPASSVGENQLKSHPQELKKPVSVEFDATGTKEIGEEATGTITVSNASESDAVTMNTGTQFITSGGQKFVSTARAAVPGAKVSGGSIKAGVANVPVQAAAIGPEYNVAAQEYTIQGYDELSASGQQMSGGSRQTVRVVTDDDVTKARQRLADQDAEAAKSELQKQFGKDFVPIPDSFVQAPGQPVSAPAVGEQATKAKLTIETTYTMIGLAKIDVNELLTQELDAELKGKNGQSVYGKGDDDIEFAQFQTFDGGSAQVRLLATGAIGPKIKTDQLAGQLTGKRYGEIEQTVRAISGVENVDIKFSPFWVNKAPGDSKKISIKFSVAHGDER